MFHIKRFKLVLGIKAFFHIVPPFALSLHWFLPGNNAQQGRFTFAVSTNKRYLITTYYFSIGMLQYGERTISLGYVLQGANNLSGLRSYRKIDIHYRHRSIRRFYYVQLIQPFYSALCGSGLCCLCTEPLYEALLLLYVILLVFKCALLQVHALHLF